MVLLFSFFQYIQYHHHHADLPIKSSSAKSSSVHPKCDICDFVAKKQNSHLEFQEIEVPSATALPLSIIGFHYQANAYFAYAILTDNKGPPSHI